MSRTAATGPNRFSKLLTLITFSDLQLHKKSQHPQPENLGDAFKELRDYRGAPSDTLADNFNG
jgi:hypothetical protein